MFLLLYIGLLWEVQISNIKEANGENGDNLTGIFMDIENTY